MEFVRPFRVGGVALLMVSAGAEGSIILNIGDSVPMSDILNEPDQTFIVQDKEFRVKTFSSATFLPENVEVQAISFGLDGVGFDLLGNLADVPGDATPSGIQFEYNVRILDDFPEFYIVDNHLAFNGFAFGDGSAATVNESVFDGETGDLLGTKLVYANGAIPEDEWVREDQLEFSPRKSLNVVKDIQMFAPLPQGIAQMSFIRQTFSQIPSPSTLLVGVVPGLGLVARRRR